MKEKIILFVIGVLFGAVIATGAFYIYTTTNNSCTSTNTNNTQMNGNRPPEIPSGQNSENGQPPEKPDGDSGQGPQQSTAQESN